MCIKINTCIPLNENYYECIGVVNGPVQFIVKFSFEEVERRGSGHSTYHWVCYIGIQRYIQSHLVALLIVERGTAPELKITFVFVYIKYCESDLISDVLKSQMAT